MEQSTDIYRGVELTFAKAFYWKCFYCETELQDGDEAVFVYETHICGNTPVHHAHQAFHKKCYEAYLIED